MLHIEQLHHAIIEMRRQAGARQQLRASLLKLAMRWLSELPEDSQLRTRLLPLVDEGPNGIGLLPAEDTPWAIQIPCPRVDRSRVVTIGVDGSQIYPDRHAPLLYYLLHIGALLFRYTQQAPETYTRAWLRYQDEDLYDAHGYLIDSETLNIERSIKEMEVAAALAERERARSVAPIIVLIDGPLLWPYMERSAEGGHLKSYLSALSRLQKVGAIPVGYVDRPGGRLLLTLLWVSRQITEGAAEEPAGQFPLRGLTDLALMEQVLTPGSRTAWFTRLSATNRLHALAGQEIWLCYGKFGSPAGASVARVEVPAWAARDREAMDMLQSVLQHQAQVLSGYPYVLARAHEEALVTSRDKGVLEQTIQRELLRDGLYTEPSAKAQQKSLLSHR